MTEQDDIARADEIRQQVRDAYGEIASAGGACCGKPSCCGASAPVEETAKAIGYSEEDLAVLPDGANMGLSCGNPTALASLHPGDTVLDLGSGGGLDVFIAARKVGPDGLAIGVDMTPSMISKARRNAAALSESQGIQHVEFRLGEIEHLPVADASVDVVISNCVINLSPDKPQVWREIARVLKPGGRVAVSDIALKRPLSDELRESVEALVGCVAGAVQAEETRRMAREAGLTDISMKARDEAVDVLFQGSDELLRSVAELVPPGRKASDYVTSLEVTARKPGQKGHSDDV